jgi:ribosomal protein L23
MTTYANLVQTEKSYNLQQSQIFTLRFSGGYQPNKIELTKILKNHGLEPLNISLVNLPDKKKFQKSKRRQLKVKKRPTKYYIKLKVGQELDDKKLEEIFPIPSNSK